MSFKISFQFIHACHSFHFIREFIVCSIQYGKKIKHLIEGIWIQKLLLTISSTD